jgi:hypothetical protein
MPKTIKPRRNKRITSFLLTLERRRVGAKAARIGRYRAGCGKPGMVPSLQAEGDAMSTAAMGMMLLLASPATVANDEAQIADPAGMPLRATPTLIARFVPHEPAERYSSRLHIHLGRVSPIRTVAGGVDTSPFVTALPGELWHGRLRSFGAANGSGFSGSAVRARSIGFDGSRRGHSVSGFLASDLRYGVTVGRDDLLAVDLSAASQRLPAVEVTGRGKSIRVGSFYLGIAFVHDRRFSLIGGWYRLSVSALSPFDYAIERTAGMPAAGQGMRLGFDWRLGPAGQAAPARFGIECRDGDADRDRLLAFGPGNGRERRMLVRFTEPF